MFLHLFILEANKQIGRSEDEGDCEGNVIEEQAGEAALESVKQIL